MFELFLIGCLMILVISFMVGTMLNLIYEVLRRITNIEAEIIKEDIPEEPPRKDSRKGIF